MKINYVMSIKTYSAIFESINNYFKEFLNNHEIYITEKPLKNMDIYHYHRPNLEDKLLNNSIVTVHHDLEDNDTSLNQNKFIERYLEASHIVCLNNTQKEILITKGIQNDKISVIPHGYNNKIFLKKKPIKLYNKENKIKLGIFSRRYGRKVKGEAYLLELLKRLDNKKFSFVLVGQDRNIDKITMEKMGFEVTLFEQLPYDMFNDLYNNIDILLMLSRFEGGPANIPEAFATGTPIISRNIAMVKDLIKNNGIIISGDIEEDIHLFTELQENKNNKYNKLMEAASTYETNMSWEDNVLKYEKIYEKINKNKGNI